MIKLSAYGQMRIFRQSITALLAVLFLVVLCGQASAQNNPPVSGHIEWGIWVDRDGCMHWWADGGLEGYMVDRVDPQSGKPVCVKRTSCLLQRSDNFFVGNSAKLTTEGRRYLQTFFQSQASFAYAVYTHTDSRGIGLHNMRLSQARARAIADVARSIGSVVEEEAGFGERQPLAPNTSPANMARNRRFEIICYW